MTFVLSHYSSAEAKHDFGPQERTAQVLKYLVSFTVCVRAWEQQSVMWKLNIDC